MLKFKDDFDLKKLKEYGFTKISSNRWIYKISHISQIIVSTEDDEFLKKGQIVFYEYIDENYATVKPIDKITNLDVIYKMFEEGMLMCDEER